jgi:hypothetical protein
MLRTVCLAVMALALLAPAKDKPGKAKGHEKHAAATMFRAADRGVIADYYRSHPAGLPPGLEKQLRRNGRLPPGLEKRMVAFPPELESRLPPCPPDVRRGISGGVALMYNSRTGVVLDIVALASR